MTANANQQDLRIYQIKLKGQVDEEFVTVYCPPGTILACENGAMCLSNIHTDQSGVIGLVRHLHNLGCTILALES